MSPSLEMILGAAVLAAAIVFVAAFRFAVRIGAQRTPMPLPRAQVRGGGARWFAGARRQRASSAMTTVQAAFVALGITSAFVMVLCAVGIVGLLIAG